MKPTFKDKQRTLFSRKKTLLERETPSEKRFRERLKEAKVHFIPQKAFIAGDFYCIVDFYLPKPHRICIEIDGGYHDTVEQRAADARKDAYLKGRGFKVVRINNCNVESTRINELLISH